MNAVDQHPALVCCYQDAAPAFRIALSQHPILLLCAQFVIRTKERRGRSLWLDRRFKLNPDLCPFHAHIGVRHPNHKKILDSIDPV